jgi:AcrR family transcriptional regulator
MSSPGLRERKKQKTRWAIQDHAMRLFAEQGYEATTVDQIATAAEISPSTFFRYFKVKEDVVVQDEYDAIIEDGLNDLDPALPPIAAIRTVMDAALRQMDEAAHTQLLQRSRLILATPALRARSMDNLIATISLLGTLVAERTGRNVEDLEVRAFAGAVVGAMISVIEIWVAQDGRLPLADVIDRTLGFLEAGLPLGASP